VADDIVTRLRHVAWLAEEGSEVVDLAAAAADKIDQLEDAIGELARAFQELTDQGDACPLCWDIFKKAGQAVNCYGHATIAELEARRG
jgi:DNA repair exonuclease SbcCD ATPase subunit